MATKKYWYHYTAIILLGLLNVGTFTVAELPTYYCDMEDSVRSCLFLKDNGQTCVYPFQINNEELSDGEEFASAGDRCQKGYTRGIWEPTDNFVRIPTELDGKVTEVNKPIIMYNAKVTKDLENIQYIEGYCTSSIEVR